MSTFKKNAIKIHNILIDFYLCKVVYYLSNKMFLFKQFCLPVVRGFPSEADFEEYILLDYTSQKVLAAIVFDCGFKNKNDPLPLQVRKFYFIRVFK